jgi:hypothetical protein
MEERNVPEPIICNRHHIVIDITNVAKDEVEELTDYLDNNYWKFKFTTDSQWLNPDMKGD